MLLASWLGQSGDMAPREFFQFKQIMSCPVKVIIRQTERITRVLCSLLLSSLRVSFSFVLMQPHFTKDAAELRLSPLFVLLFTSVTADTLTPPSHSEQLFTLKKTGGVLSLQQVHAVSIFQLLYIIVNGVITFTIVTYREHRDTGHTHSDVRTNLFGLYVVVL